MKTRLVSAEFEKDYGINVTLKEGYGASIVHGHDFYELDIILNGKNSGALNRDSVQLSRGNVFFMTPEDFHEFGEEGTLDILNIHFTEESVSGEVLALAVNSDQRLFSIPEDRFAKIEKLSLALNDLYKDSADMEVLSRLLESVLLLLQRENFNKRPHTADTSYEMQKAITYIHAHFKENPSLTEVASVIPLNERYFCKKFKEYTGETYKAYLKKLKLRYSRRLILSSSFSMLEIAERSGYATQSHFNREFKAQYGITPSELRNN